ncbi:protein AAR2-like protein [Dinothrombium tinctorium]|uniref:Protein AAR2 homolog n=1 Tax=Dinothrombium tinctorium TaxID=1965070 RepID=A0A3S4REN9_9ACAR|nr:protein AAR2-like protein [Dinothrombium tinctorium]
MDEESARKLLDEGATFILLDIPVGSELGIDCNVYRIGEKFRGIKMIPRGLHFIYYSVVSNSDHKSLAPRTGFFHVFEAREMLVKKWHAFNEDISDEEVSEEEKYRFECNLRGTLDQFLAPYPLDNHRKWVGLTDYITESVLNALNPKCGKIKSVTELIPQQYSSSHQSDNELSSMRLSPSLSTNPEDLLPQMKANPESAIRFAEIPKQRHPLGATPSEITKHNIDSSFILQQLMSQNPDRLYILGELQFAFVSFLVGQVFDAFERWKLLLQIMCKSDEAIAKHTDIYINFIRVLYFQLEEAPSDLFVDIVDKDNVLTRNLYEFFSNIELREAIDENLRKRAQKFKRYLTNKFKWDFDTEPEDEAPVVV